MNIDLITASPKTATGLAVWLHVTKLASFCHIYGPIHTHKSSVHVHFGRWTFLCLLCSLQVYEWVFLAWGALDEWTERVKWMFHFPCFYTSYTNILSLICCVFFTLFIYLFILNYGWGCNTSNFRLLPQRNIVFSILIFHSPSFSRPEVEL